MPGTLVKVHHATSEIFWRSVSDACKFHVHALMHLTYLMLFIVSDTANVGCVHSNVDTIYEVLLYISVSQATTFIFEGSIIKLGLTQKDWQFIERSVYLTLSWAKPIIMVDMLCKKRIVLHCRKT